MPVTRYENMDRNDNFTSGRGGKKPLPPCLKCNKCGSTWFSIEKYSEFQADFTVSLGMTPPTMPDSPECSILRCVCGELYEINANRLANNNLNKKYDDFLDCVDAVK